eukprot:2123971-Prymnesium_polylepis.1
MAARGRCIRSPHPNAPALYRLSCAQSTQTTRDRQGSRERGGGVGDTTLAPNRSVSKKRLEPR